MFENIQNLYNLLIDWLNPGRLWAWCLFSCRLAARVEQAAGVGVAVFVQGPRLVLELPALLQ